MNGWIPKVLTPRLEFTGLFDFMLTPKVIR